MNRLRHWWAMHRAYQPHTVQAAWIDGQAMSTCDQCDYTSIGPEWDVMADDLAHVRDTSPRLRAASARA